MKSCWNYFRLPQLLNVNKYRIKIPNWAINNGPSSTAPFFSGTSKHSTCAVHFLLSLEKWCCLTCTETSSYVLSGYFRNCHIAAVLTLFNNLKKPCKRMIHENALVLWYVHQPSSGVIDVKHHLHSTGCLRTITKKGHFIEALTRLRNIYNHSLHIKLQRQLF